MRSIACLSFAHASLLTVALTDLGHDAYPTSDSRGRPVLITDACEADLDLVILECPCA